jgi:hypothetical protein
LCVCSAQRHSSQGWRLRTRHASTPENAMSACEMCARVVASSMRARVLQSGVHGIPATSPQRCRNVRHRRSQTPPPPPPLPPPQRMNLGPGEKEAGPCATYIRGITCKELTEDMARVLAERHTGAFKGFTPMLFAVMCGGKANEVPLAATACPDRCVPFTRRVRAGRTRECVLCTLRVHAWSTRGRVFGRAPASPASVALASRCVRPQRLLGSSCTRAAAARTCAGAIVANSAAPGGAITGRAPASLTPQQCCLRLELASAPQVEPLLAHPAGDVEEGDGPRHARPRRGEWCTLPPHVHSLRVHML